MYYRIYQLTSLLFFALAFPPFLIYSVLTGKHSAGLGQRLGFYKENTTNGEHSLRIWLHAASVGEVQVARSLVAEIKDKIPGAEIILSTVTEQGQIVAQKQMGPEINCIYAPLDLPYIVNRALGTLKPSIYICLETEIWPNMLRLADRKGCKTLLLNGRLSQKSFTRYKMIKPFMNEVLAHFHMISTVQERDAKRYITLGADPDKVLVSGNAKYDLLNTDTPPDIEARYRRWLDIENGQPILVAGSTHTGEEGLLIQVFRNLKSQIKDLVWVVAPRHLERLAEIDALFSGEKLSFDYFSQAKQTGRQHDVVLIDTMGDLAGLYSVAKYVFCGGSLVPKGGHNIMEAAIWGKPVHYGPSMKDFSDAKEQLESVAAGFPVKQARELADSIHFLAANPEIYKKAAQNARIIARAQQGSAAKQIMLVQKELDN